jgi:predicted nucleotide-binding protein (sugar kinase/HSP70/actin superfamily)
VLVFVFTDEITASLRHISQGQQENREAIIERFDQAEASQQNVLQNQQTMHQTLTRIEGIILEGRAGTLGTSL